MKKNNKGQSTIEFVLTFTAAVGFIFLFLKMALNYTNGYMVHHATFMASRAYLVSDAELYDNDKVGDPAAYELAKAVFRKNLPEALMPDFDGTVMVNAPDSGKLSTFTGVWTQFSQAFSLSFIGGKDSILFRSESFLGREPTRAESALQICQSIMAVASISSCDKHATLEDNGG